MNPSSPSPTNRPSSKPQPGRPGLFRRLQPELQWLERDRSKRQRQTLGLLMGIAVTTALLGWFAWTAQAAPVLYAVLVTLALLVARFVFGQSKNARSQSKHKIVSRFAKALGPRFVSLPNGGVSETDFVQSQLFNEVLRSFRSGNHLRGQIGTGQAGTGQAGTGQTGPGSTGPVRLEISELHTTAESGQRKAHALFDGLWIIAQFPASLRTNTLIKPVSDRFDSEPEGYRNLKLEEGSFSRLFDVSAEDSVEARYLLSSSFLGLINDFLARTGRETHFALMGQWVHIAVRQSPDLSGPAFAQSLFEALDLTVGLVRELEANPYIWNKPVSEPRPVGPEMVEFAVHTTQERNPTVGPRYRKSEDLELAKPELVKPESAKPEPTKFEPTKPELAKPKSNNIGSEKVVSLET
jgi:Protein of unknown function (DUF3137)